MALLSVAVLGAPEVRHGARSVVFPTRKALAALVYLLVEGRTHRRDKLVAFFWPESDEQAGRATLRSTLARLRASLEEADGDVHLLIERDAVGFDFASDFDLDLNELRRAYDAAQSVGRAPLAGERRHDLMERLQRGAAVWRGEFLDGFLLREAPDFDDWVGTQQELWRRRAGVVLDRLSLLQVEGGSTAGALETAERWLRLDPLEEHAHRRLIQLHLAAGDRGAAMRAYEACRAILLDELGVPPEPETEALATRIRAAPARPAAAPRAGVHPAAPFLDGPIVGREDEFSGLVEHYLDAARGRTRAIVLQGEAGIGKTRLAGAFLNWATAQGADALRGQAFESGARLPYQPLIDALRPRLERETDLAAVLSDTWLAEVSRILPELCDRRPALPAPEGDEAVARTRLFEAIARLGRAFATRAPLVLFVDDVQWADVASLDVLRYVGRRWTQDGTPVLLLLCLRSEALATPTLANWLQGLRRDLEVADLELGPLSFADTRRLLYGSDSVANASSLADAFARWIYEETSGQPFFVVETVRALSERGALTPRQTDDGAWVVEVRASPDPREHGRLLPAGVRRIVQARLAPLPPAARDLLTAAAVLGQGFGFDLLGHVSHLSDDDALAALDAVVRARLLRETGDGEAGSTSDQGRSRYVFAHDKIRDVVYAEAGDARRSVFHRRALDALEAAGAPAAELARHALASGQDEPALQYSVAAGDAAIRLLAARDAAAHYARAIALAERLGRDDLLGQLHARRGRAFVSVAMWTDARLELDAALIRLPPQERDQRAEILVDLADACFWTMDVVSMRRHASDVLAIAADLGRGDLESKALAWLATAEGSAGNLPACVERNQVAIDRARALGIRPPPVAYFRSMALYWLGRHAEAVHGIGESVEVAREANDVSWTMWSLPNLGLALAGTGQYAAAAQAFDEARQLGRTYGAETLLARALACSAGFRLDLFDFAGAEARSQEARELARSLGFTPPAVSAGIDLLLNYARRGEVGQTERLLEEVAAGAAQAAGFHGWLWALRLAEAQAEIALAQGKAEEALRWADEAIAQCRARGRVKYEVLGLVTRGKALSAAGRASEAVADFRRAVTLARPVGDPALLLQAIGCLLPLEGDDTLAAEGTATVARIVNALADADERRRFETSGPQQALMRHLRSALKTCPA
jgi:DNA-binding SARP family transcriptional activator